MISLFLIILISTSALSLWIGYGVGRKKGPGQNVVLHYLKSEIHALIFTRQNWTAREIDWRVSSTISEIEKARSTRDLKAVNLGLKGAGRRAGSH